LLGFRLRLDEGFDAVALEARRLVPARLLAILPVGWLAVINLGFPVALAWAGLAVAGETWTWLSTGPLTRGGEPMRGQRLHFVVSGLCVTTTWLGLAHLYWSGPTSGLQFDALLIWAALLLSGVSMGFRSTLGLAVFAAPVAAAMLLEPLAIQRYHGAQEVTVVAGMMVCVVYALMCALQNLRATFALEAASARLEDQVQAVEAASRAKSTFLAMMSHELRTPMNGVLGMAHALGTTRMDAHQQDYVRTLIRSGDGLMAILNDILDLSKIEAGRLEIEDGAFDLRDLVERSCELWRQAAQEKGLALVLDVAPDAPRWIKGDALRVRQIVLNLLSNAVKFTAAGEVRVQLKRGADAAGFVLSVADTGSGISPQVQETLFQPFAQADVSIARRHGGTGLGLSICRQLARLMGGEIALQSSAGQGACFTVALPASEVAAPPAHASAAQPRGLSAGLRVLVVDDNPTNRAVARALLEAVGVDLDLACDGAEALAALRVQPFDAVLMDVHMPVMDGIEAVARIRRGEAGDPQRPVIALTADAMAGERERLLNLGFDDYLSKPINPTELIAALARLETADEALALSA
jgi:two-component system, sensor histidine kinase